MTETSEKTRGSKLLFFAPYSAIWRHAFPEALVAESLKKAGNEVVYVTCGRQFKDFCIGMSALGLAQESSPEDKERICQQCTQNKSLIRKEFGLGGYDLASQLSDIDHRDVEEILSQTTQDNFQDLLIDGIPVGNLAVYEFLLQHKKGDTQFTPEQWCRYLITLKNALFSFYGGRRILDLEKPQKIIVYNGLYSTNSVFCKLAEKRGIPYYFLHAGPNLAHRLSSMMIGRGHVFNFFENLKGQWPRYRDVPCTPDELKLVTDHFVELFKGRSVFAYSSPKQLGSFSIRKFFDIKEAQKVLVAVLGSYDEQVAAEKAGFFPSEYDVLFRTQIDWVDSLIKYVKERSDLFLVVRVHPREFPNKRDRQKSEHAEQIEKKFQNLPSNVKLNFPSDNLSVYDLAEETDVFLSCWSSVGKEMALLGIPVVIYSDILVGYTTDINFLAKTEGEYFKAVDAALKAGWDFERLRLSYRWYVLEYVRSVLDLSDACHLSETRPPFVVRAARKVVEKLDPLFFQRVNCKLRPSRLGVTKVTNDIMSKNLSSVLETRNGLSGRAATIEEETRSIKNELKRLIVAMYGKDNLVPHSNTLLEKLTTASRD